MTTRIIRFPLDGAWILENSPADRVPSHGTHAFASTYAVDFVMPDRVNGIRKFYSKPFLAYLVNGVRKEDCPGYGREVRAVFDGTVVDVRNDIPERERVNAFADLANTLMVNRKVREGSATIADLCGNYVILKRNGEEVYAVFAHLKPGSVRVKRGDILKEGEVLGKVGHSGNSTAPHLHLQLMDNADHAKARGLEFRFGEVEILDGDVWAKKTSYMPPAGEPVRYGGS